MTFTIRLNTDLTKENRELRLIDINCYEIKSYVYQVYSVIKLYKTLGPNYLIFCYYAVLYSISLYLS